MKGVMCLIVVVYGIYLVTAGSFVGHVMQLSDTNYECALREGKLDLQQASGGRDLRAETSERAEIVARCSDALAETKVLAKLAQ